MMDNIESSADKLWKEIEQQQKQKPLGKPVIECQEAMTRQAQLFYLNGKCLCSSFYTCPYQSKHYTIDEGRIMRECEKK